MIVTIAVFVVVVMADQLTKSAVIARLHEGAATTGILYGIRLRHVANRRTPWRSGVGLKWMAALLLMFAAAGGGMASVIGKPSVYAGLGAVVGGAAGNLLDGFNRRAVTDFIDLRVWPVFNLADAAIVGGAVILLRELSVR